MASLIYTSFLDDVAKGNIDCDSNTFKAMLVTSTYSPNQTTHTKRSDITNEVTGTGYTAGGATSAVTVTKVIASNLVSIQFDAVNWASSTITARGCVYYKSRGGASSADELVAYCDFGSNISTSGGTFTVTATTISLEL
jgi:hypothetical protein